MRAPGAVELFVAMRMSISCKPLASSMRDGVLSVAKRCPLDVCRSGLLSSKFSPKKVVLLPDKFKRVSIKAESLKMCLMKSI